MVLKILDINGWYTLTNNIQMYLTNCKRIKRKHPWLMRWEESSVELYLWRD